MNSDEVSPDNWYKRNKITVNILENKSHAPLICPKVIPDTEECRIGDEQIQLSYKEKLLGIIVDTSLNWAVQVEVTIKNATPYYIYLEEEK